MATIAQDQVRALNLVKNLALNLEDRLSRAERSVDGLRSAGITQEERAVLEAEMKSLRSEGITQEERAMLEAEMKSQEEEAHACKKESTKMYVLHLVGCLTECYLGAKVVS